MSRVAASCARLLRRVDMCEGTEGRRGAGSGLPRWGAEDARAASDPLRPVVEEKRTLEVELGLRGWHCVGVPAGVRTSSVVFLTQAVMWPWHGAIPSARLSARPGRTAVIPSRRCAREPAPVVARGAGSPRYA